MASRHTRKRNVPNIVYRCQHCGKFFGRDADRKRHELTLHNPRAPRIACPYAHEGCTYSVVVKQKSNMNSHVDAMHLKVQNVKCNLCSFRSAHASSVSRHKKESHTGSNRVQASKSQRRKERTVKEEPSSGSNQPVSQAAEDVAVVEESVASNEASLPPPPSDIPSFSPPPDVDTIAVFENSMTTNDFALIVDIAYLIPAYLIFASQITMSGNPFFWTYFIQFFYALDRYTLSAIARGEAYFNPVVQNILADVVQQAEDATLQYYAVLNQTLSTYDALFGPDMYSSPPQPEFQDMQWGYDSTPSLSPSSSSSSLSSSSMDSFTFGSPVQDAFSATQSFGSYNCSTAASDPSFATGSVSKVDPEVYAEWLRVTQGSSSLRNNVGVSAF